MSTVSQEVMSRFLTNTDETGRFIMTSKRTGRTYCVEPIGDPHVEWGSVNPGSDDLMVKKAWKKHTGSIAAKDSLITEANGFKNIKMCEPGLSPHKYIEWIDDQYPSVEGYDQTEPTTAVVGEIIRG